MTAPLINTIFFDMGWTLRHTVKDAVEQQEWLKKIIHLTGLPWTPAEMAERFTERAQAYKKWGEGSLVELTPQELWLKWLLPELPQDFVEANTLELNHCWRRSIGEGQLFPGTVEVINTLFQRGYRLGIISNTVSSEETPNLLQKYGIDRLFEVVILSCNFGKRKPDPSIFQAAVEYMGIDPANCAYIGDQMDRDIAGSQRAGFSLSILVRHETGRIEAAGIPENEAEQPPDHVVHSLPEILDIFPQRMLKTSQPLAARPAARKDKPLWDVSLSTMWSCENKIALPELLPILETLELNGIELNHAVRSSDLMGYDLGCLPIQSIHEPCPADVSLHALVRKDWQVSSTNEEKRRQGVRMIMRSIDLCCTLGMTHLVVHPGNNGLTDRDEKVLRALLEAGRKETGEYRTLKNSMAEHRKLVSENCMRSVTLSLKELLDYASGKNVCLALENRYHLMDIPSPDEMEMLLSLAGPDRLGMQFDVGHAQALDMMGFYPFMEWVDRFARRIIGLHLHDVRGVVDHYAPGMGDINYRQFVKAIPAGARRTLEVHGTNTLSELSAGLQLLGDIGLIHRVD